mgnify:FL=1
MPIYTVSNKKAEPGQAPRLVRASNKAQALRHVADEFEVEAGMRDSITAAGLRPRRGAAKVH